MSENLDLVRSIFADWERGDYRSADGRTPRSSSSSPTGLLRTLERTGRYGKGFRETLNAWEDLRDVVEDYREIDQERVLVPVRLTGRGRTSGLDLADIASRAAYLFHLRDGKVTKIVIYMNRDRLFADLGLEE